MKILAIDHEAPGVTPEQFKPHLQAETRQVLELMQADVLREIYFRQDQSGAVLVLECVDVQEAQTMLDTLPLVKAGLIDFEVIGLRPYPGFARLFTA